MCVCGNNCQTIFQHFYYLIPLAICEKSNLPIFLPEFGMMLFKILVIVEGVKWDLFVVLICISQMTKDMNYSYSYWPCVYPYFEVSI